VVETLALHPCLGDDSGALFLLEWASLLCRDLDSAEGALAEPAPPVAAVRVPLSTTEPLSRAGEIDTFGA
jgi:hypothetical protein